MGSRSGRRASIGGGNISLFGIMTAFLPSFDTLYSSAKDPAKAMANLQRMPADAKAQAVAFLTRRKMEQDLGNRLVSISKGRERPEPQVVFGDPRVQAVLGLLGQRILWASTLFDGFMK